MTAALAESFDQHRTHLLSVGYRLTGSVADAEDAVQDAWLRLSGVPADSIDDLRGWLTTVVGRLCLDRLGSAARRRESYVGQWLPEPIVTALESDTGRDPLETVVRDEDNRIAALVVLDHMTPAQRVAFVLHDGFAVPFAEIAEVLGVEVSAARQLASRARKAAAAAPEPTPDTEHNAAVGRLLAAIATGDLNAVIAELHPDAKLIGDSNGKTRTAVNIVAGAPKVARFALGLIAKYGPQALAALEPVLVNGQLGLLTKGTPGDGVHPPAAPRVGGFSVRDGRVWAYYDFANPDKQSGVRV